MLTQNLLQPKITIAADDLTEEQQVAIREEGLDIQKLDPENPVENPQKL